MTFTIKPIHWHQSSRSSIGETWRGRRMFHVFVIEQSFSGWVWSGGLMNEYGGTTGGVRRLVDSLEECFRDADEWLRERVERELAPAPVKEEE